jgi:hypothetical protein
VTVYNSRSYAYITIYGDDFYPPELTNILDIQPTEQGIKGEKVDFCATLKECFWQYSLPETDAIEGLDQSISKLLKVFTPKMGSIKDYVSKNSLCVKLYIVITARNNEHNGVLINPQFIDFLHHLEACLEVDIYDENCLKDVTPAV